MKQGVGTYRNPDTQVFVSDPRVPLNDGEITLSSHVYKIYCSFLKDRLLSWVEGNNLLCDEQNEFRPGRNCLDHNRRLPVSLILLP